GWSPRSSPVALYRATGVHHELDGAGETRDQFGRAGWLEALESPLRIAHESPYTDDHLGRWKTKLKVPAKTFGAGKRERWQSRNAKCVFRPGAHEPHRVFQGIIQRKRNGGLAGLVQELRQHGRGNLIRLIAGRNAEYAAG